MPNIIINGISSDTDKEKLLKFRDALVDNCVRINDLDVKSRNFVFIPASLLPIDDGGKIVIIAFIRRRGKRTDDVFQQVADDLTETAKIYFPNKQITCYVRPHEEGMGFAVKK